MKNPTFTEKEADLIRRLVVKHQSSLLFNKKHSKLFPYTEVSAEMVETCKKILLKLVAIDFNNVKRVIMTKLVSIADINGKVGKCPNCGGLKAVYNTKTKVMICWACGKEI